MADKKEREIRPEVQQRCIEDRFSLDDAVCRDFSLLQPEAILRQVLVLNETIKGNQHLKTSSQKRRCRYIS